MTEKYNNFLLSLPLFEGFNEADLSCISPCLEMRYKSFTKGDIIWLQGDNLKEIGLIIQGAVDINLNDILGGSFLIERVTKGNVFAGVLLCAQIERSPFTVGAAADCDILFLNYQKLITPCPNICPRHSMIIRNLLKLIAQKNMLLQNRLQIISQKNIRERLLVYLRSLATKNTSFTFKLPMTRTALAAYLCVNRSALQRQLTQMQKENIIKIKGGNITLSKKSA